MKIQAQQTKTQLYRDTLLNLKEGEYFEVENKTEWSSLYTVVKNLNKENKSQWKVTSKKDIQSGTVRYYGYKILLDEDYSSGVKTCVYCRETKILKKFDRRETGKYRPYCRECLKGKKIEPMTDMIICPSCHEDKHINEFPARKNSKYRRTRKKCLECVRKSINDCKRFRLYGLTKADYNNMFELQNGKCKICNKEKKLCVDHCHKTGAVRGLVCHTCNTAIGMVEEDVKILQNIISYLENSH